MTTCLDPRGSRIAMHRNAVSPRSLPSTPLHSTPARCIVMLSRHSALTAKVCMVDATARAAGRLGGWLVGSEVSVGRGSSTSTAHTDGPTDRPATQPNRSALRTNNPPQGSFQCPKGPRCPQQDFVVVLACCASSTHPPTHLRVRVCVRACVRACVSSSCVRAHMMTSHTQAKIKDNPGPSLCRSLVPWFCNIRFLAHFAAPNWTARFGQAVRAA